MNSRFLTQFIGLKYDTQQIDLQLDLKAIEYCT